MSESSEPSDVGGVESGGVAKFRNLGQVGSQQNDADLAMQMV